MKVRIRLEYTNFAQQFTDNHQKHGNIRDIATKVETILHQRANRAIAMLVKIIMMVLGNRK